MAKTKRVTLVEKSTKVIVTEKAIVRNNFCIDEARNIVKLLYSLTFRSGGRIALEVTTKNRTMSYNCTEFCCPRLEIHTLRNGSKHLTITDGVNTHTISPFDEIRALRNVKKYLIGEDY